MMRWADAISANVQVQRRKPFKLQVEIKSEKVCGNLSDWPIAAGFGLQPSCLGRPSRKPSTPIIDGWLEFVGT